MTDPISVLHLLPTGGIGGQEQYVASLCRRMQSVVPEVRNKVCFSMSGGEVAEKIRGQGTPVFILDLSSGYDILGSFKLLSLVKREKIDVIHSHGPLPVLNIMAKFSRAPVQVMTDHGPTKGSQVKREWRRAFFLRLMTKTIDKYIAISGNMVETLAVRERIPREAITIIYNGVAVDVLRSASHTLQGAPPPGDLPFPPGTPLIGTVSRLVTDKRIHLFLEVCSRIVRRNDAVHFIIAGDGPLRKELEESGAFLDVRDHTFGAKLRDFLNLRHPSYGEAGPAVEAVTSRNVQAVVYGTIHRFESTENATELDLEISLAAVPSGELLFTRRYDEQQGSGLLPGAETPESIRRIGFAKRFFLLALLILLLPVFTIVFIRTMVRKRENRSNALTLGVYTAADAILALLLLGTDFRSFLSVLFLLVIITAALLYNVAIMTHAVRLEAE